VTAFLAAVGDWARFSARASLGILRIRPYAGEVLRQAALITAGSVLVILLITFVVGATCGLQSTVIARQVGAGTAAPIFSAVCTVRDTVPVVFGVILAAKVGCGVVAEIGAMQVNEEVDALEVMGVPSMVYLVSVRLLAAAIVVPPIYITSVASAQAGAWLSSYVRFGDISQGSWEQAFYSALRPEDFLYSTTKASVLFFVVMLTALYFGHSVRGGPVQVGEAAARSMFANITLIAVMNPILSLSLWGFDTPVPIA
jgi:phospholipid/cholesterol/gamma-HCH transport system permease protein